MKKLIVTAMLLIFAGCTNSRLENQWVGKNVSNLTNQLGTPNQIKYDGLASKIYVYMEATDSTAKKQLQQDPNSPVVEMQGKGKLTLFWINRKGMITKVKQKNVTLSAER